MTKKTISVSQETFEMLETLSGEFAHIMAKKTFTWDDTLYCAVKLLIDDKHRLAKIADIYLLGILTERREINDRKHK